MSEWTTALAVTFALGCITVYWRSSGASGSQISYPLPPGPPGLPWVGPVLEIDTTTPWLTYTEWAKKYGDIIHFRLLGKDVIVINSEKIARELLENRSRNYSDRPFIITNEMCGMGFNSVAMSYGDRWRLHRQFFHQTFRSEAASRFVPFQDRKAGHLLRRLFGTPEELNNHVFEYTASIILNCVYEYDPASRNDELIDIMANLLNTFIPVMRPDISIKLGAFPFLLYLPSWFPGMSIKKDMARVRELSKQYLDRPFEHSLQSVRSGSTAPSMASDALRDAEDKGISPDKLWMRTLKEACGTAFVAASETSEAVLMTFFLMMMLNPAAQEKAQAQIDEVVGKNRLPTVMDRPLLPFVDAVFWESLRYRPTGPLSFAHASVDDDIYNGFRIPKGSIVFPNAWSMSRDESKYPNPHEFIPERFLYDDGTLKPNDIAHIVYGFGRRVCAGKHFADISVWSVIAKVLAVFKILKPLDENGMEINVEPKFSNGLVIHPLPFRYRIVPRNPGMDAAKLDELIAASAA